MRSNGNGPKRLPDGQLDLSQCPQCGSATSLLVEETEPELLRVWRCETCDCCWRQVGHRDAVRVLPLRRRGQGGGT